MYYANEIVPTTNYTMTTKASERQQNRKIR